MANDVTFYVLQNTLVNFSLTGKKFLQQFVKRKTLSTAPLSLTKVKPANGLTQILPQLYAAALDSGYGINAADLLQATPALWNGLSSYLQNRLMGVLSILEQSAAGNWNKAGFVDELESNEQGSMAYALGMLFCRDAIEQWGNITGSGVPKRFWHYKVATHSAVSLKGQINQNYASNQNPDFIVEMANNDWVSVEAKGTVKGSDPSALRDGLGQAHKYQAIAFTDQKSGALVNANIGHQVCTQAYFNGYSLEVTHLHTTTLGVLPIPSVTKTPRLIISPPHHNQLELFDELELDARDERENLSAEDTERPRPEESMYLLVQAGDLLRYRQAYLQFQLFSPLPHDEQLMAMETVLPDFSWRVSSPWPGLVIGLPKALEFNSQHIQWSLHVLEILTPVFGSCRARAQDGNDDIREDIRKTIDLLKKTDAVIKKRESWERLLKMLGNIADSLDSVGWLAGLNSLLDEEIIRDKDFDPDCGNWSLRTLRDTVAAKIQAATQAIVLASKHLLETPNLAFTSHGLAVMQLPAKFQLRQIKKSDGLTM